MYRVLRNSRIHVIPARYGDVNQYGEHIEDTEKNK
jgi:hypothetical protein